MKIEAKEEIDVKNLYGEDCILSSDEFLSKNSVYGIVYDKRFYISSQIAVFIFGIEFQKTNTHHFYKFVQLFL